MGLDRRAESDGVRQEERQSDGVVGKSESNGNYNGNGNGSRGHARMTARMAPWASEIPYRNEPGRTERL